MLHVPTRVVRTQAGNIVLPTDVSILKYCAVYVPVDSDVPTRCRAKFAVKNMKIPSEFVC